MTTPTTFSDKFKEFNVVVVGDVMLDAYLWGSVTRISPEAPVPVVCIDHREQRLGGAANVALNIKAMGAKPFLCSVLGNDDPGKDFLNIMYRHDMDKRGIVTSDDRTTTKKSRIIGNNMHIVRVDEETTRPLAPLDEEEAERRLAMLTKMQRIDAIIFQDYDKGCLTPRLIETLTALARRKHIVTAAAPKHRNFKHYLGITLLMPDLAELQENTGVEIDDSSPAALQRGLSAAAIKLYHEQQAEIVLVPLNHHGIYACDFRGEEPLSLLTAGSHSHAINDVSGANDTMIGIATLALAAGIALKDVVRYADIAGGIVCEQVGTVPIDRDRLLRELAVDPSTALRQG